MSKKKTTTELVPVEQLSNNLQLEGLRVSRKEIAELMLQEAEMNLQDKLELLNKQSCAANKQLETSRKTLNEKIEAEVKSNETLMSAIQSVIGKEFKVQVTVSNSYRGSGWNNSDVFNVIRHYMGRVPQYGSGYQNDDDSDDCEVLMLEQLKKQTHLEEIKVTFYDGKSPDYSESYIRKSFKAEDFPSIAEFNKLTNETALKIKSLEEEMAEVREEMRLLSKNSRRVTAKIVKAQLGQSDAGKKLVAEIEGMVNEAGKQLLEAPVVVDKPKRKTTKK